MQYLCDKCYKPIYSEIDEHSEPQFYHSKCFNELMKSRKQLKATSYIGKTIEDPDHGRGTIIDETPDNVIIALEGEGVSWLVVAKSALVEVGD